MFQQPEIIQLIDSGVITTKEESNTSLIEGSKNLLQEPFLPTDVTIFLTTDCNLGCMYCYGDGGERQTSIAPEAAFAAVDLVFENAKKIGSCHANVNFHGGGEPTLALELMESLTRYTHRKAKTENVTSLIGLTTNGIWSDKVTEWVLENVDNLNISFDGTDKIQNFQRPLRHGGASYPYLAQSIKKLDSAGKNYCMRSTVTQHSQDHVEEIAAFICTHFHPQIIQIEPMFESDRASRSAFSAPDPMRFIQGMIKAEKICHEAGVELKFSGLRFPQMSKAFCSIGRSNFAVTVEGKVTACFEVLEDEDHRSDVFFYGSFDGKSFVFDEKKIEHLRHISETTPAGCKDCFVKFHCSGDCLGKGYYYSTDHSQYSGAGRCDIIRGLIREKLKKELTDQGRGEIHVGEEK